MKLADQEQLTQQLELKGSRLRYHYERGDISGYDIADTLACLKEAKEYGTSTIEAQLLLEDIEQFLEFI